MSEKTLGILVTASDRGASKTVSKVRKEVSALEKTVSNIKSTASKGLGTAAKNIEMMGVAAGAMAVGGGLAAIKWAADFESQLNTIATVLDATGRQHLPEIGAGIRKMARDNGAPLEDLTSSYYDLISAGVKWQDAQPILNSAMQLSVGGLGTMSETVDLLTSAMNTYGLDATGVAQVTDMFAQAIADGKVKASDIAATFAEVGEIAKTSGIGIDEIAAAYGRLTAMGVPATEVTTQMRSAIKELIQPNKTLAALQDKTGKSFAQMAKDKGLVVALEEMRKAAEGAGIPFVDLFGRIEGFQFALATTGEGFSGYQAELTKMSSSTGRAAEQMAERQKGLNFQLDKLKALAKDAGITIGNKLLPKLTPLLEKLGAFVDQHQGDIEKLGDDVASGFDAMATAAAKVDWAKFAGALKDAASAGGSLVKAFLDAPQWVQELLIGGFAVNKISGGAVADIAGELGKGLIKGVLGMNAGVVNVNAGMVNGGGIPGVGGAVGGTGIMAALTPFLPAIAAAAVAASLAFVKIQQTEQNKQLESDFAGKSQAWMNGAGRTPAELQQSLDGINSQIEKWNSGWDIESLAFQANIDGVADAVYAQRDALQQRLESIKGAIQGESVKDQITQLKSDMSSAAYQSYRQGERESGLLAAIAAKNFSPTVTAGFTVGVTVDGRKVAAVTTERTLVAKVGTKVAY